MISEEQRQAARDRAWRDANETLEACRKAGFAVLVLVTGLLGWAAGTALWQCDGLMALALVIGGLSAMTLALCVWVLATHSR